MKVGLYHGNSLDIFKQGLDWNKVETLFVVDDPPDLGSVLRFQGKTYSVCMISQKSEFTEVKEIKIKEGEDCDFESNITCPYCGHQNIDSWESNDSEDEETCGRCGGVFSYQRDVEVTYSSSPVRAPEIKEYQLQGEKE